MIRNIALVTQIRTNRDGTFKKSVCHKFLEGYLVNRA